MTIYFILSIFLILSSVLLYEIRKKLNLRKQFLRRQQIGRAGEERTVQQLEKLRGYKKILRNLYVPCPDGRNTAEIDIVVIHEKGIFVVENKNYSGKIYGDEREQYWLQVQKESGKRWKKHFYSPILQNQSHIRNMAKYLHERGDWEISYLSVIVFNDSAKLKRIRIFREDTLAANCRKARRKIRKKIRWKPKNLTRREINEIFEELKRLEDPGKKIRREHGKYVNHFR